MTTNAKFGVPLPAIAASNARPGAAALAVAVALAGALGAASLFAFRSHAAPVDVPLVERCDQLSIQATERLDAKDARDATPAAARKARERSFNECIDREAIRGMARP